MCTRTINLFSGETSVWQNWLKEISNHLPGSLGYSLGVVIHFFCWHVAYSTAKVVEENVLFSSHLAFHSYCYGRFRNRLISCDISWPRVEANLWPHANIFRESLHLSRENVCGLWISYSEQSEQCDKHIGLPSSECVSYDIVLKLPH